MRRACLAAALTIVLLITRAMPAEGFDPAGASILQLRAAMDAGRLSCATLVRYYLDRIERLDHSGPHINALITLNPQALSQAMGLDARARGHARRGPLYCIPFVAKDNFNTAGIATSGGSAVLGNSVPTANAFVIQRLLDQEAILIGKANMSELAASYGRLGYSSAGGLTLNPYNTARDVSGSSSGSAAALAADFAAFALGTDTTGSVRAPASVAGLVGMRPTLGLSSRSGIMPLSLSFDTPGVLTRTVEDLAIVLDAIAGPDAEDAATSAQPRRQEAYLASLSAGATGASLKGLRLGVVSNFRGANAEVDDVERAARARLVAQGAVLVPVMLPGRFEHLWNLVLGPVGQAEFKPQFERYLSTLPATQPRTLAQLINLSASAAAQGSLTPINPERLEALRRADASSRSDAQARARILEHTMPALRRQLRALMGGQRLQALVFATMSCPATPRFDRADPSYVCHSDDPYKASYMASATGFPEITVPAGRISGNLPVGISFMGWPFGEARLLALAGEFERSLPRAPPPELH
jgi:amidase